MTADTREAIRARAERVSEWAQLYGDEVARFLLDSEDGYTARMLEDGLYCAHDVLDLLSELERLGHGGQA